MYTSAIRWSVRVEKRKTDRVVFVASTLLCLVLLEVAAGHLFRTTPMTSGKKLVLTAISGRDRFVRVKDGFMQSHPYLLYTNRPGFASDGVVQINSLGYRGREITLEKPPGTYRILALGGSTTLSWPYIKDPNRTWTAQVEAGLSRRFPGRKFEVINAGLPYGTSAELLAGYMFRHRYLKPDLVIIHEGGNDVSPLMFENYNPEYTHFRASGVSVFAGRLARLLLHSNVFRLLYSSFWKGVPSVYVSEPYDLGLIPPDLALKRVQETYPLGFERNIDLLVRTIKQDGARVLLVGFVAAREENMAKNRPDLAGLGKAIALGIDKDLRVLEQIGARYDVPYLSPAAVEFKDEWFLDSCHLTPEGEKAKADWILGGVVNMIGEN